MTLILALSYLSEDGEKHWAVFADSKVSDSLNSDKVTDKIQPIDNFFVASSGYEDNITKIIGKYKESEKLTFCEFLEQEYKMYANIGLTTTFPDFLILASNRTLYRYLSKFNECEVIENFCSIGYNSKAAEKLLSKFYTQRPKMSLQHAKDFAFSTFDFISPLDEDISDIPEDGAKEIYIVTTENKNVRPLDPLELGVSKGTADAAFDVIVSRAIFNSEKQVLIMEKVIEKEEE